MSAFTAKTRDPTVGRCPGRPRSDATRAAILHAAYDLLGEAGLGGFTIEGVAGRSGVARTTIYRWWPSKGALAMEGFLAGMVADLHAPMTGSVVADMQSMLRRLAGLMRGKAGRIMASIVAEGQSDPETIKAYMDGFVRPRRAEVTALMERGMASGELRADLDVEIVLYNLFGALYLRLLMHEDLSDAWVDRLSATVLANCVASKST